jgi:hypothetical protein
MKRFALCAVAFLLVLVLVPRADFARAGSGAASITTRSMNLAVDPDVHGFFFFKGRVPAAFRNIDHLNLDIPGGLGTPPYYGQIRLKAPAGTDYKLLPPTLNGKHLSFKTKKVGGASYQFDGTLTRTNFDSPEPSSDEVVLSGTLKKIKGGKVVASSRVRYTWFLGD